MATKKKQSEKKRPAARARAKSAKPSRPPRSAAKKQPAGAKPARAEKKPAVAKPPLGKSASSAPAKATGAARAPASGDALVGKKAPAFALRDQAETSVESTSLAGKPYVLYFYPKDDTPGCTREACDFRDGIGAFSRAKIRVIGVSPDSTGSHARFAQKYSLPFTLLSDPEKVLADAYGVWVKKKNYGREYMGVERSTFLIDARGVVRHAWRGVKVAGHSEEVLAAVRELG